MFYKAPAVTSQQEEQARSDESRRRENQSLTWGAPAITRHNLRHAYHPYPVEHRGWIFAPLPRGWRGGSWVGRGAGAGIDSDFRYYLLEVVARVQQCRAQERGIEYLRSVGGRLRK